MSNTTLHGWQPPAGELVWVQPTQAEDASAGITACSLPTGEALVMWPLGGDVRYAVLPAMAHLQYDDVVDAGDIGTALTPGGSVYRTTVFAYGGQVYFAALGDDSATDQFWVRIYQADDPSDPSAGWSLHGTVEPGVNIPVGWTDFGGTLNVGQPIILGSRWVIAAADAYTAAFGAGGFWGRDASIWTSDDSGVTWEKQVTYQTGSPGHHAPHSPPQIVQHPGSGDLIASKILDADFTDTITSADSGETWTTPGYTGGDNKLWQPFVDNGTDVFGVNAFVSTGDIYRLDGTEWVLVASIWDTSAGFFDAIGEGGEAVKFIVDRGRLWFFVGDYVASSGGWHVGHVGQ